MAWTSRPSPMACSNPSSWGRCTGLSRRLPGTRRSKRPHPYSGWGTSQNPHCLPLERSCIFMSFWTRRARFLGNTDTMKMAKDWGFFANILPKVNAANTTVTATPIMLSNGLLSNRSGVILRPMRTRSTTLETSGLELIENHLLSRSQDIRSGLDTSKVPHVRVEPCLCCYEVLGMKKASRFS